MPSDFLGNPIAHADPGTLAAIDEFVSGLLGYRDGITAIEGAAAQDPDCCLAGVYAGVLQLLGERESAASAAAPYIALADAASHRASPRERLLLRALKAWADDAIDETISVFEQAAATWPRDLAAIKLAQYHQFNRGDFAGMLRIAKAGLHGAADVAAAHGMAAFAYEQLHLLDKAETAARAALALAPEEPWAQHALAHVMLTQGRIDEGVAFLEAARPNWTGLNSFMLTHLWWHLALFYLSQGREGEALGAFDAVVWAVDKSYSQDQVNAVSLLARLELADVDPGARWIDLGENLAGRAHDVLQPFLSVHYLYGLAKAGRPETETLYAALAERARTDGGVWERAALPLAQGLVAYARAAYEEAFGCLARALPQLGDLGGSHAQRDLFEQILLDAQIRSGRLGSAQQQLELRRVHDPDGVPLNRTLAGVYRALDLPEEAGEAEQRIRRRSGRT